MSQLAAKSVITDFASLQKYNTDLKLTPITDATLNNYKDDPADRLITDQKLSRSIEYSLTQPPSIHATNLRLSIELHHRLVIRNATLYPEELRTTVKVDDLCKLVEKFYPIDFDEDERTSLRMELQHFELVRQFLDFDTLTEISELCQWLTRTRKSNMFPLLYKFNLKFSNSSSIILRYDLALEIAVTKSCNTDEVKYDRIEANGYYGSERFGSVTLNPFVQHESRNNLKFISSCKNPRLVVLRPVFKGEKMINLDAAESARFNMETVVMFYNILMEMQLRVRVEGGIGGNYKFRVGCGLKVPLTSDGRAAASFNYTKCNIHSSSL
ncbi:hypothetical protein QQ045_023575 [Rhodiola kirilowii]